MPLSIVVTLASCNNEDENLASGESKITLRGTAQQPNTNGADARITVGAFTVTHFEVGLQDFDMYYAASADIRAGVDISGITLRSSANTGLSTAASQPKTNILIQQGNHQSTVIGEGLSPHGYYQEVTLKLFQNNSAVQDSFAKGKSLYILGNINGKTVRIWMTAEESLRVEAAGTNGYEINSDTELVLWFNLNSLFSNMNLATALDTNGDGMVDIGPNNVDGNGALHTKIKANLESSIELVK